MIPNNNGNIIIYQINDDSIKEVKPDFLLDCSIQTLIIDDKKIQWAPYYKSFAGSNSIIVTNEDGCIKIDSSIDTRVIVNDQIKGTTIHYLDGRVGIGRGPLHAYKFDIAVPENSLTTAFHIGDGQFGFSMGNGTSQGFVPEIIGMGADENDAGLYFIGRAGNNLDSSIPLIIFDGRNFNNQIVDNRPILGITNSNYNKYLFMIDNRGLVKVQETIKAKDFILDSSISMNDLVRLIIEQGKEIDILKAKISELEKLTS